MTPFEIPRISPQATAIAILRAHLDGVENFLGEFKKKLSHEVRPSIPQMTSPRVGFSIELKLAETFNGTDAEKSELMRLLEKVLETLVTSAISFKERPLPEPVRVALVDVTKDGRHFNVVVSITLL